MTARQVQEPRGGAGGAAVAPTRLYTTGSFLPERTVLGAPTPGLTLITEQRNSFLSQFLGKYHGGPHSQRL